MGFYDDTAGPEATATDLPDNHVHRHDAAQDPDAGSNDPENPVEVKIAISRPPETIMQTAYVCYDMQKLRILEDLFSQSRPQRVIIFSSSKMKVKELASTSNE